MNNAVITRLTSEQIVARIKRRVMKNHPTAYHIYVGDFSLYKKERGGCINTYVKAKTMFSVEGCDEEVVCEVDFGIE